MPRITFSWENLISGYFAPFVKDKKLDLGGTVQKYKEKNYGEGFQVFGSDPIFIPEMLCSLSIRLRFSQGQALTLRAF
jgi:hypothetical protein